jgi:hypothetical protein
MKKKDAPKKRLNPRRLETLLRQIEDIKKMVNRDGKIIVAIDGKHYTFDAFIEKVLEAVKEGDKK